MTEPQGPGDFETLNQGNGGEKDWFQQAATRGSSLWDAYKDYQDALVETRDKVQDVAQGGELADNVPSPDLGVAVFSLRAELLTSLASPGQAFMENGLGFLVSIVLSPLIELGEYVIGDPEQMRATGKGWDNVATWLDNVAEQEQKRAQATADSWVGKDGDAFRTQMSEFAEGVKALAADIRDLKSTLDTWADLIDMFVEFLIQTITELVIGLIVQWLAALAASWVTAGASVATASAGTAVQVGTTGARIGARIAQLQGKLFQLFQKVERLLQKLREMGPLRKVINKMEDLRGGRLFEEKFKHVQQMAGRRLDRQNSAFKIVTQANSEDLTSKGGKFLKSDITETDAYQKAAKNLDDRIAEARRLGNDDVDKALTADRENLKKDMKGVQGLASGVTGTVLHGALGGKTTIGEAAFAAGTDVAMDAAIEQSAHQIYDTGKGWFQGDLSSEQRDAAQERGFQ
ncbi:WXG100 family type VII secretion target [Saccharopolyspora rectivirgula]|uniref:Outer membrane channel protein CpnT-like N-terminal domain-containing protein n=1 Tax=Saccharopolyspora rectivirgula TaxID=28042 RepID=A0A073AZK1_9PSEU|nr:hypothetical protein [Saccharopolyspora rectivirgula]KEI44815.1 hypothetical protein GU90_07925 [Saccharopolyspora rectivirgula]